MYNVTLTKETYHLHNIKENAVAVYMVDPLNALVCKFILLNQG